MDIIWIDDTKEREDVSGVLGSKIGWSIDFVSVNGEKIEPIILEILATRTPDLFILDHSLNLAKSKTIRTGSTLALMIRDKLPACPIICVTAGNNEAKIDSRHREVYELVIDEDEISNYYQHIKSLLIGFDYITDIDFNSSADLTSLLNPNEEDFERITSILPISLKMDFENKSIKLDFYRWIYFVLIQRPGFLLDKLWTSTLVGLTEKGFDKVEDLFEPAVYDGIFSSDDDKRWWKSRVLEVLGTTVEESGLPWMLGRYLVPDSPEDYPVCFSSEEEYPDTVAFVDPTDNERVPIKTRYTIPHPHYEDMIFFEQMSIMKGA